MGAFNYIRIQGKCPVCGQDSSILCQTHIASDYDGNLELGRFHDHIYELGQKMPWFDSDEDRDLWYSYDELKVSENVAREGCYSKCEACKSDIYVLIQFENITPIKVIEIGFENQMHEKYR